MNEIEPMKCPCLYWAMTADQMNSRSTGHHPKCDGTGQWKELNALSVSVICNNCPHEKIDHHNADVFCCEIAEAGMFCTLCRCASFTARHDDKRKYVPESCHSCGSDRMGEYRFDGLEACSNCGYPMATQDSFRPDEARGDKGGQSIIRLPVRYNGNLHSIFESSWVEGLRKGEYHDFPELLNFDGYVGHNCLSEADADRVGDFIVNAINNYESLSRQLQAERSRREDAENVLREYQDRERWDDRVENGSGTINFRQAVVFSSGPCDGFDFADRYFEKYPADTSESGE